MLAVRLPEHGVDDEARGGEHKQEEEREVKTIQVSRDKLVEVLEAWHAQQSDTDILEQIKEMRK